MTTSTDSAAATGLPISTHRLAVALDGYLALTATPLAASPAIRLSGPAFEAEQHSYMAIPDEPDLESGFSAMARFRWEVENEIERLIALLDAIDGDPDLEITSTETRGAGFVPCVIDDSEADDNGLADEGGAQEQMLRSRGIAYFVEMRP